MLINSTIRNIISEAFGDQLEDFEDTSQQVKVPFSAEEDSVVPPSENVDSAVASGVAQQGAEAAFGAGSGVSLSASPNNIEQSITVQKTLVNTDLIRAILSEIKALVVNSERIFDKEDLESADAQIYIGNLINSLNTSTEKLTAFVESPAESPVEPASEVPEPGVE